MNTEELRRVAEAATPLDFDSAEIKRLTEQEIECPYCQGNGSITLEADYCNFDGTAIGVEFYGVGNAHGAAEAFVRAFNPKTAIELLDRLAALEAENAALKADAERYRWWRSDEASVLVKLFGNGCINKTIEMAEAEIDAQIAARSKP